MIWGQLAPVAGPRIAEAILERCPDTTYLKLDDTGHYPQWEAAWRVTMSS